MAVSIPFRKLHGLGNDFVLLDGISADLPLQQLTDPDLRARLCDRHHGIGSDGILLLLPPQLSGADVKMRMFNSDGSEAEMCGNGIRCLAKAAHDHLPQFQRRTDLTVETCAGLLRTELVLGDHGEVTAARVAMGKPSLERAALPMTGTGGGGPFLDQRVQLGELELISTAVSMGNPHLVTFVEDGREPRRLAEELGPQLERHPWFPRRTNVEFARRRGDGLALWVWERGCGITLACGTGACATAVAAVATGRHHCGQPLRLELPGGVLTVTVEEGLRQVWLEGPAVEVFQGTVEIRL